MNFIYRYEWEKEEVGGRGVKGLLGPENALSNLCTKYLEDKSGGNKRKNESVGFGLSRKKEQNRMKRKRFVRFN